MKNGYFQLVNCPGGFGVKLFPPLDGGQDIVLGEVASYLTKHNIVYDPFELKKAERINQETTVFLGVGPCPIVNENYDLFISENLMEVSVRFYAPSESGVRIEQSELIKDLQFKKIIYGVKLERVHTHFQSGCYCTDILLAQGKPAIQGTDAYIEYCFNVDIDAKPVQNEDGSVDFFNLDTINNCKKGDVLAKLILEKEGEIGYDIYQNIIKPHNVKKAVLRGNRNAVLSEDKLSIMSLVDGHVVLVDDKIFVSDVYEVENVDISTGNIVYDGSVKVNGNVQSNFRIVAKGNVVVNGVVEGAYIEAGGDIIIARGMNGMGKGILKAEGNIIVQYLENVNAEAKGYVNAGTILHSKVIAGTEIEVDGKRGIINGGHVIAAKKVTVKTLGSEMGIATTLEVVGISPQIKKQYIDNQKEINDIVKIMKDAQVILKNFAEKRAKGVNISEAHLKYMVDLSQLYKLKNEELSEKNKLNLELQGMFANQSQAVILVKNVVHPGTTIVIGDIAMNVKTNYHYCRFEKVGGSIQHSPL